MKEDRIGKLNDGGYNNLLLVGLFVVVVYLFVSGFTKSKQQAYLDNAGNDKTTQLAQALRDAMNRSGIKIMMSVDGTDVDLIMQTATQISDYKAVSDAYRVLYSSELTTDLSEELSRTDLQRFYDIVYKRATGPTTGTAGKSVTATQTVKVRKFENYNTVDHQAKQGELIGTYVGETSLTVGSTKSLFVIVESVSFVLFKSKYYVLKSAVKIL